jgi:hypothetical protein
VELVARFFHQYVFVGEIYDAGFNLTFHHRDDAIFRARHIAAIAELNAFALRDDVADGFSASATRMECEGLAIEIFPRLVLFVDDREKHEPRTLKQNPQGCLALLNDGIGGADTEVCLAVHDSLNCKVLFGKVRDVEVDALLLCALERNDHR